MLFPGLNTTSGGADAGRRPHGGRPGCGLARVLGVPRRSRRDVRRRAGARHRARSPTATGAGSTSPSSPRRTACSRWSTDGKTLSIDLRGGGRRLIATLDAVDLSMSSHVASRRGAVSRATCRATGGIATHDVVARCSPTAGRRPPSRRRRDTADDDRDDRRPPRAPTTDHAADRRRPPTAAARPSRRRRLRPHAPATAAADAPAPPAGGAPIGHRSPLDAHRCARRRRAASARSAPAIDSRRAVRRARSSPARLPFDGPDGVIGHRRRNSLKRLPAAPTACPPPGWSAPPPGAAATGIWAAGAPRPTAGTGTGAGGAVHDHSATARAGHRRNSAGALPCSVRRASPRPRLGYHSPAPTGHVRHRQPSTRSRTSSGAVGLAAPRASSAPPPRQRSASGRAPPQAVTVPAPAPAARRLRAAGRTPATGRRVVYSRVAAADLGGRGRRHGSSRPTSCRAARVSRTPARTSVYSRSMYTYSTANPAIKWRYMVRFAYGPGGGRIGFHEIPNRNGVPLQSERQLGQPLSGGCVRQSTADAEWMWNWAGVGTNVVVALTIAAAPVRLGDGRRDEAAGEHLAVLVELGAAEGEAADDVGAGGLDGAGQLVEALARVEGERAEHRGLLAAHRRQVGDRRQRPRRLADDEQPVHPRADRARCRRPGSPPGRAGAAWSGR